MFDGLSWQGLTIGSSLLFVLAIWISKHQAHKASSIQVNFSKYPASILVATVFWLITSRIWPSNWWLMMGFGLISGVSVSANVAALRHSLSQTVLTVPMATVTQVTLIRTPLIIIVTSLIGLMIYKERLKLTKKKIFGMEIAFVLLGIVLGLA